MPIQTCPRVLPLRIDVRNKQVWQGERLVKLTRRAFEVLCCLVNLQGTLVTKETLFRTVWHGDGVVVGDAAITTCIREIRKALGENVKNPQYIQTTSRYGYRFIGPLANPEDFFATRRAKGKRPSVPEGAAGSRPERLGSPLSTPSCVGRDVEFAKLHGQLTKMLTGTRQMVFITGEAGIGKTTVVKSFLRKVAVAGEIGIGYCQCVEQFGAGEPFRPVLEAVGRICREPGGAFLVDWMKHYTPLWLLQIPALIKPEDLDALRRTVHGASRDRMLREMSEGVEILTEKRPLILVIEDLHWSDAATLDLIATLARRHERARFMVIGTYRPEEGLTDGHPLKAMMQELLGHQLGQEIQLSPLRKADVETYIEEQFPLALLPTRLSAALYENTGGNPLFLAAVIDDLKARGILVPTAAGEWLLHERLDALLAEVPSSIRQLLERQMNRLSADEQRILQAASMVGREFSSAAVAAAIQGEQVEIEKCCAALIRRRHFLQPAAYDDATPGEPSARYTFRHVLYQSLWAEQVPMSLRRQCHLRIAEYLESAYGKRRGEIAAELALHFEQGGAYERALTYRHQASRNAIQRFSHREAITHLTQGLTLLSHLTDGEDRGRQELNLQLALGAAVIATHGYGAPEVEVSYDRALELCCQVEDRSQLLQALWGLESFYAVRGKFNLARQISEQCLVIVQAHDNPGRRVHAHWALGQSLSHLGEFAAARDHLQQALDLYGAQEHRAVALQDPGVTSFAYLSLVSCILGYPDQATIQREDASRLAHQLGHPFSSAFALTLAATLAVIQGEAAAAQQYAQQAIELSQKHGFPFWLHSASTAFARSLCMQGRWADGLSLLQEASAAWQASGAQASLSLALGWLAESYKESGRTQDGLHTIAQALSLVAENGERYYAAELYRLKGELILQQSDDTNPLRHPIPNARSLTTSTRANREREAEECFLHAVDIARQQQGKMWELRATISLSRLWHSQGRTEEAWLILSGLYHWFAEGTDSRDLATAREVLVTLTEPRSKRSIRSAS